MSDQQENPQKLQLDSDLKKIKDEFTAMSEDIQKDMNDEQKKVIAIKARQFAFKIRKIGSMLVDPQFKLDLRWFKLKCEKIKAKGLCIGCPLYSTECLYGKWMDELER